MRRGFTTGMLPQERAEPRSVTEPDRTTKLAMIRPGGGYAGHSLSAFFRARQLVVVARSHERVGVDNPGTANQSESRLSIPSPEVARVHDRIG